MAVANRLRHFLNSGSLQWPGLPVVLLAIAAFSQPVRADTLPLEFEACQPDTRFPASAECASLEVAENPDDPGGRQISVHIARLPARGPKTLPDPLVLLAGGPGQAASDAFPPVLPAFDNIREHRDLYLIDQRGTGLSNILQCPDSKQVNDPLVFDEHAIEEHTVHCQSALAGDPRYYTTSVAVRDLELFRQLLGIQQLNLYGISYGTRVALHYLKRYPDSVRTLILDAVVPPDVSLGAELAINAQRSLTLLLRRCEQDPDCHGAFPTIRQDADALITGLKANPREIIVENFRQGGTASQTFTASHLNLTLRMLSYAAETAVLIPFLIHDAHSRQNFAPLVRQAELQADSLGSMLASGMHNAVICTEDEPYIDPTLAGQTRQTYLGDLPIRALKASCRHWPRGIIDDDFKQPVVSDRPVLILSGETDPITPPSYGERVASTLTRSLHIVNPGRGHMQALLGCTPLILARFVERANPDDVDFGCLERQTPPPFFIDANGPRP